MIGIPSLVQFEQDGEEVTDSQGKIRPINLLKTFIAAAKAGEDWTSPYFVAGSGAEEFTLPASPVSRCRQAAAIPLPTRQGVCPPGRKRSVAILEASGMATGLDYSYAWLLEPPEGKAEVVEVGPPSRWEEGQNATWCIDAPPDLINEQGTMPTGPTSSVMRAGPSLTVVGAAEIAVGGAAAPTGGETPRRRAHDSGVGLPG